MLDIKNKFPLPYLKNKNKYLLVSAMINAYFGPRHFLIVISVFVFDEGGTIPDVYFFYDPIKPFTSVFFPRPLALHTLTDLKRTHRVYFCFRPPGLGGRSYYCCWGSGFWVRVFFGGFAAFGFAFADFGSAFFFLPLSSLLP